MDLKLKKPIDAEEKEELNTILESLPNNIKSKKDVSRLFTQLDDILFDDNSVLTKHVDFVSNYLFIFKLFWIFNKNTLTSIMNGNTNKMLELLNFKNIFLYCLYLCTFIKSSFMVTFYGISIVSWLFYTENNLVKFSLTIFNLIHYLCIRSLFDNKQNLFKLYDYVIVDIFCFYILYDFNFIIQLIGMMVITYIYSQLPCYYKKIKKHITNYIINKKFNNFLKDINIRANELMENIAITECKCSNPFNNDSEQCEHCELCEHSEQCDQCEHSEQCEHCEHCEQEYKQCEHRELCDKHRERCEYCEQTKRRDEERKRFEQAERSDEGVDEVG